MGHAPDVPQLVDEDDAVRSLATMVSVAASATTVPAATASVTTASAASAAAAPVAATPGVAAPVAAAPVPGAVAGPLALASIPPVIASVCPTSVVRAAPGRAAPPMPTGVAPGVGATVASLMDVHEDAADRAEDEQEDAADDDGVFHRSALDGAEVPPDQYGRWSAGFQGVPAPARSWLLWLALVGRVRPACR
jgi:hypothetical protein